MDDASNTAVLIVFIFFSILENSDKYWMNKGVSCISTCNTIKSDEIKQHKRGTGPSRLACSKYAVADLGSGFVLPASLSGSLCVLSEG